MNKGYQTFEARAFHPDLGAENLEGMIQFSSLALRFQSSDAVLEIPLHRLEAKIEQTGEERIFFSDPEQPGLQISTLDSSVLEVRATPQMAALCDQLTARLTRREMSHRTKLVVGFFAIGGLVLWLGMVAMGAMVRSVVGNVSPEFEKHYGDTVLADLKTEMSFANDTNQTAHLAAMAAPLLRALPADRTQWQFDIVTNEFPNAFALPGGHVVVTTGLLLLAERPEELVGTIAHEVAHVTEKHGFRKQISSAGPFLILQVFLSGRGGAVGVLAGGSALLVNQSFSQEYENEADEAGWRYLVAANIDPRGMIEMFRKLKAWEATQKTMDFLPHAFQSHPDLEKRIARLETKWKKLPRKTGFIELEDGRRHE